MSQAMVSERRRCAICGSEATNQVSPDMAWYEIHHFNGSRRQVDPPPMQDFCADHFTEVRVLGTRHVGLCLRCQAWRPAGGVPCPKCGSTLLLTSGAHRWSR
jgi:RNA polymerase subunit RPABC4/transcription elongation factor Spt4